ncbi:site-specific DNA-methyltransferase [Kordiimonas laminariae]|uniref:site-specific DNA-methyltransferase n=1 Tax=Kordiimonas laminariae TaxID=2917717 RepID=UPI001FF5E7FD|nr:site-specific DNA-methyltransferase [Kordiimonas laminariae]MCK0069409.1 site-specific DNA-methyltransferase [Kordiimonas laminariae]
MEATVEYSPPPVVDYTDIYEAIMQFNKNKTAFIHQWYPFVEGYSREFIESIINELDYEPTHVLDPFAGSGTTPVELQAMGIKCSSFEVSPFMHLLASTKLNTQYHLSSFERELTRMSGFLRGALLPIRQYMSPPLAKTFQPRKGLKKWVFDQGVMNGILDVKYTISCTDDAKYRSLFNVALASILLDVSNVYRNGKCLSYKKKWQETKMSRREVHERFLAKLEKMKDDIAQIEKSEYLVQNRFDCHYGDVRSSIDVLAEDSIDLVITSPPYLNSRDYTDIYMAELWMLGLVSSYEDIRALRRRTLRSHVQVKLGEVETPEVSKLQESLRALDAVDADLWNEDIPNMIKAYFLDMDLLFKKMKAKMAPSKKVFFNVANSAYYGVKVDVDEIVSEIADQHGFHVEEIREARKLEPSSQQKKQVGKLRESVIVMTS